MKKIIHLSDLHIGYGDLGNRFECVANNIIFGKQPADQYVIVITGDIGENAFAGSGFDEAEMHIERLRTAGYTVLVAPGNHDYGTGNIANKKYVRRFWNQLIKKPNVSYPNLDIIENIAFIGLDSMAKELKWYDALFSNGELGDKQLGRLGVILNRKSVKQCDYRVVYLHHHPFDPLPFHELKDSEALGKTLIKAGNVDAILYGHNHAGKKRNGKWGIPRCYDAGTATRKKSGAGYHRVIDLSRDARLDYDGDFHGSY